MARLGKLQPIIHSVLISNPETRSNDYLLVLNVYKHFISVDMTFKTVLEHHGEFGLPSFASIIRIRRILQKKYPELDKGTEMRKKEEADFREYVLNN